MTCVLIINFGHRDAYPQGRTWYTCEDRKRIK